MLKTQKIPLDSKVVQSKGTIVSDMDGEKVMMSIQKGKYYNLGLVGGVIWDALQTPVSISKLIDHLLSLYDVQYSECKEQVMPFLENMYKEGLIEIGE